MKVENIVKIADISADQIRRDQTLQENIYNIESTLSDNDFEALEAFIMADLEHIQELIKEADCSYLRIIYN